MELLSPGNHRLPRIAVLEVFVENPESPLSAPEVEKSAGVSRRAAYYIIKDFVKEGLLVRISKKGATQLYALNQNDTRSSPLVYIEKLLTIGRLEAEMKREEGIGQSELLEGSLLSETRPQLRRAIPTEFITIRPDIAIAGTLGQSQRSFREIVPGDQVQVTSLVANPREFGCTSNVPSTPSAWQCG